MYRFLFFFLLFQGANANIVDIYEKAKDYDPVFKSEYFKHKINLEKHPQALSTLLPKLNFSASTTATRVKSIPEQGNESVVNYNNHDFGVSLNQSVFNLANWENLSISKLEERKSFYSYSLAQQELLLRVTTKYLGVLADADDLFFSSSRVSSFLQKLKEAKEKLNVSIASVTDVHEAQARYDRALSDKIFAENKLINSKDEFLEITGQQIKSFYKLKPDVKFASPNPIDINHWVNQSYQNNLNIKIQEHSEKINKKNIRVASASHYPEVKLNGSLLKSKGGASDYTIRKTTGSVGLRVDFNLFAGGAISSNVRTAMYQYELADISYQQTKDQIKNLVRSSYRGIMTSISQIKALKQAVLSSEESLKATEEAYNVGTRTIIDVLDAQNNVFDSKKDYSKARYNYIIQLLTLKQAVGSLDIKDIKEVNRWLQLS